MSFLEFHVNTVIWYESFVSDLFSLNTLETHLCHLQVSISVVHSFLVHSLAVSLGFGYCMFWIWVFLCLCVCVCGSFTTSILSLHFYLLLQPWTLISVIFCSGYSFPFSLLPCSESLDSVSRLRICGTQFILLPFAIKKKIKPSFSFCL